MFEERSWTYELLLGHPMNLRHLHFLLLLAKDAVRESHEETTEPEGHQRAVSAAESRNDFRDVKTL